jgi:hypothetical protein
MYCFWVKKKKILFLGKKEVLTIDKQPLEFSLRTTQDNQPRSVYYQPISGWSGPDQLGPIPNLK